MKVIGKNAEEMQRQINAIIRACGLSAKSQKMARFREEGNPKSYYRKTIRRRKAASRLPKE